MYRSKPSPKSTSFDETNFLDHDFLTKLTKSKCLNGTKYLNQEVTKLVILKCLVELKYLNQDVYTK